MNSRVVIGTAGHVDHGKTALVRALTGIDTDRLPEEKRRGITLEAGYAHLDLPGVGSAGVVDVPGHERFLKAMVAAAGGIDLAILCIACDEGVMPQTREHLDVLRLLGVRRGVVALTKCDLLEPEMRDLLDADLRALVRETFLQDAPMLEVSAHTGQGVPGLVTALTEAARTLAPRSQTGPLFLPLDRSFALKGFGTVVTGTLLSGELDPEAEIDLLGAGAERRGLRVRSIQVHGESVQRALAGQRTAVNLPQLSAQDAPRGSALVQAGTDAARILDVEVELLDGAQPLGPRAVRLLAHLGTAQTPCVLALLEPRTLEPGGRALGQLRLAQPVAAIAGLRFLLRGGGMRKHASTLGGGRVLSIAARKRKPREAQALRDLADERPSVQAERILLEAGQSGGSSALLVQRGAFARKQADKALLELSQAHKAVLFDREAGLFVHAQALAQLEERIARALRGARRTGSVRTDPVPREVPREGPREVPREELRQRAGSAPIKLFNKALTSMQERGELQADAELVRPPGVSRTLDSPEEARLAQVLDEAGLSPPRISELQKNFPAAPALLKSLSRKGRASKVSEELWFSSPALLELKRRVLAHLAQHGSIDAQSFKELTGLSRKFAIPLLEWFDKERLTLRVGDRRVLRKGGA